MIEMSFCRSQVKKIIRAIVSMFKLKLRHMRQF